MAIDFPNSPSSGDIHTVSGKQWSWDGEKWLAYGVSLSPSILKVDTGNNRVGINQVAPTVALDVTGSARITGDLTVSGTTVTVDSASVLVKDRIQFEGATADGYETVLLATDPTADRTITLPNATGTVVLSTGNAATATALETARTIGGTSFDGTANITPANATLAATATALATARTINGVSFDGSANITVVDSTMLPLAGGAMTGAITTNSTFDGVDIATRDAVLTSTTTTANAALPKAGGTLTGAVDAGDQIISKAVFKDVGETLVTNGTSGSAATIDLENGNFYKITLTANCTLTFSNPPASGTAGSFTLFLVQDGTGSRTVTWPGSVDWAAATAPTLTTTAAGVDVLTFITLDGGTVWNGFVAGQAMG